MRKCLFLGTVFLASAVIALAAGSLFQPAQHYNVGQKPWSITAGDFNEDGFADIVAANSVSDNISVLLNSGNGAFGGAVNYGAGNEPFSVTTGDFDEDGHIDLAVSNASSDDVSILIGIGDGTFASAVNYGAGYGPRKITTGDFNEDGHTDLALADYYNSVSIFLGVGDGTFASAVDYGAGFGPTGITTGDFDEDGHTDLAVSNDAGDDVSILLGAGDGTFASAGSYPAGDACFSVTTGDFDEDGHADLAVANTLSDNVSVLLGAGDGTFASAVNYGAGVDPRSVVTGDFNKDDHADLAVANISTDDVSVLLGLGDGTFTSAVSYSAGDGPYSITTGDFDGNSFLDLAVANQNSNNVSVLIHTPYPIITFITDIPNDQGKQVSITWTKCAFDYLGSPTPITQYAIYRKIDHDLAATSAAANSRDLVARPRGARLGAAAPAYPPGDWHYLTAVPARCEDTYSTVVATLADSTITGGMYYTTFFVSAMTATIGIYFDSSPDSGYSVDNLSPHVPAGFFVAYNAESGNELSWEASPDGDFQYFCVYRDADSDFTPTPENLVFKTTGTVWLDTIEEGWQYSYKITAVDFSGNESPAASPDEITGDHVRTIPKAFILYQNLPNPFNPVTAIRFDLPRPVHATLRVYNVRGELVATLVDGYLSDGGKEIRWDARDDSGREVSSGVYFYRLAAGDFVQVRKMVLVR